MRYLMEVDDGMAERRLAELRRRGWANWEIAEELGLSEGAVRRRITRLGLAARRDTCMRCGEPIEQPATGRPRKFCSDWCRRFKGRLVLRRLECPVCGRRFKQGHVSAIYCSLACNKRASYLRGTSATQRRRRG